MALTDYSAYFLYVFISIFVVVNPIQATLIFISLTSGESREGRKRISLRATNISFAIAMLFALAGDAILRFFGITVDSLRVAGGILLFLVAIDMLRGKESKKVTEEEMADASLRNDISVFPLATPLVTGPGTMTTVVVQMGAALDVYHKILVLIAIVITFVATYFILRSSDYINRALGVTGILVMTRIQGLILGAIAVNFVTLGIWNIAVALMKGG